MNARKGFDAKELLALERDLDRDQAGGRPKRDEDEIIEDFKHEMREFYSEQKRRVLEKLKGRLK